MNTQQTVHTPCSREFQTGQTARVRDPRVVVSHPETLCVHTHFAKGSARCTYVKTDTFRPCVHGTHTTHPETCIPVCTRSARSHGGR